MVALGMQVFTDSKNDAPVSRSDRETEVIELVATGYTNQEIADHLFLSPHTVKDHASAIYRKLGVRNRAEAAAGRAPRSDDRPRERLEGPPAEQNPLRPGDRWGSALNPRAENYPPMAEPRTAILFPGQGSQSPEMRELVAEFAPELLELARPPSATTPLARRRHPLRPARDLHSLCSRMDRGRAPRGELPGRATRWASSPRSPSAAPSRSRRPSAGCRARPAYGGGGGQRGRRHAGGDRRAPGGRSWPASSACWSPTRTHPTSSSSPAPVWASPMPRSRLPSASSERSRLNVRGAFHTPAMAPARPCLDFLDGIIRAPSPGDRP